MPTIGGIALANSHRVPDRDAVIDDHRRWTWSQLEVDIARAAASMLGLGMRKGDRLALLSSNSAEFIIASHAASRLGLIVVPINTRLAPPEVAFILDDCGAAWVGCDAQSTNLAESACAASLLSRPAALYGESAHPALLVDGDRDPVHEDQAEEGDDAFILYTSGTTGRPKGAVIDHHRAVWAAMAQIVSLGLRDGDRYLHLAPMYHSGGTTFLNTSTLLGGTHVVATGFDPTVTLDLIERAKVTWLFAVPTMYQQILRQRNTRQRDLTSWRVGVFGAAPMPSAAVEELLVAFPGVEIFQQCGQTEAGPTGIYSTMVQVRSNPQSSGHIAQPFMEARVVGPDGADTRPEQVGELIFRGEAVMKGYWNQPAATADTLRDGWLHTGDLMRVENDGSLTLVDRLKDVIITGGRNVYSAEVEQAISSHPDIADVAVIGKPDPIWGETVVAVVSVVDGKTLEPLDVQSYCRSRIADYKIPRIVLFGEVPRNAAGKLQKRLLRTMSVEPS